MTHHTPTLTLLGPLALRIENQRQKLPFAGRTRQLFAYFAAHANVGLRRERLLDELWPDTAPQRAASGLNTAVWRIKKGLAAYRGLRLDSIDDVLRLTVETPAQTDIQTLRDSVERAVPDPVSGKLEETAYHGLLAASSTCRGPFLDGCSDHWVLPLRERFTALHAHALKLLMHHCAARCDFEGALAHGQAILTLDPFREGTQREVMWLYAFNGQRAQAIRQFHDLSQLLQAELGIAPMPETIALYQRIIQARGSIAQMTGSATLDGSLTQELTRAICPAPTDAASV